MADEKSFKDGAFSAPPAGAPHEVTSGVPTAPGYADASGRVVTAQDLARRFEQPEPVYAPKPMTRAQQVALIGEEAVRRAEAAMTLERGAKVPATTQELPSGSAKAPESVIVSGVKPVDQPLPSATRRLRRPHAERPAVEPPAAGIVLTDADALPGPTMSPESQAVIEGKFDAAIQAMNDLTLKVVEEESRLAAATDVTPDATGGDGVQAEGTPSGEPATEPAVVQPPSPPPVEEEIYPDPAVPYRPAASDTDSPSRGQPTAVADPGKQITGGFGDLGHAQYFPLTGAEARELVYAKMDQLYAQLQDDLRFQEAQVYPRCEIELTLTVKAFASPGFEIRRVVPINNKTPIDVAREHGDEVVFVIVHQHVEMTDAGESITPPNVTRQQLGLQVPRKQAITTPTGRQIVDVRTSLND